MSTNRRPEPSGAQPVIYGLLSRESLITATALVVIIGLAWAWLISASTADGGDMHGMAMPAEPWSLAYLLPAFAMWAIMMVAMMTPSAAPMILLHARIDRADTARSRLLHSFLFIAAYLLVWTAFSGAAVAAQALLIASGLVSAAALSIGDRAIAAVVLVAAAIYELTAAKRLCLEKCQSPLLFVLRFWRPGAAGALRLGIAHGLFCVGCCWTLMLLLFVGGVMNLAWVAFLGLVVLGEKVAPAGWHMHRWMAALLILGAGVFLWA